MKYNIGDLVFIKSFRFLIHPDPPADRLNDICGYCLHPELYNTYGIITKVEKHTDIFEQGSIEGDNGYFWLSQVDGKEYFFYENEVDGEIV